VGIFLTLYTYYSFYLTVFPTGEVSVPEVRVFPPTEYMYVPNYCQYFFAHLGANRERNVGVIAQVIFTKQNDHTVLRITWEGSIRKRGCFNCCSRWWIEIDGSPCSKYEDISTSITSNVAQDIFAPTTISGFCAESGELGIGDGDKQIRLLVGACPGYGFTNTGSGQYSTSRMIVDELPLCELSVLSLAGRLRGRWGGATHTYSISLLRVGVHI